MDNKLLLSALLKPTIEMMREAGVLRMTVGKSKDCVLQMESGEVVTLELNQESK